jgi:hypothetical protein
LDFVGFALLDISFYFFEKNEEVIWAVHLSTFLLKFGEGGPSVFSDFTGAFYVKNPTKSKKSYSS